MTIEDLKKQKKILIIGYGLEGRAVEAFLKKYCPNVVFGIVDKKDGEDYLAKQQEYDLAIKSPGVKPELIMIPYTTATNIFFANCRGKIIGVTGTKGKSTTSILLYEMLKKQGVHAFLGGNIGEPALHFLDEVTADSWVVLELSSFQLQDIKFSPHIAVVLMLSSEHLDYHKDVDSYISAKRNILRFQKSDDFAVINRDYPASHESDIETQGQVFAVSRERETENGCYVFGERIWISKNGQKEELMKITDVKLLGKHNLENICAAIMSARLAGVKKEIIVSILKTFRGLSHRLEYVGEEEGILFYNDSLATIPEATIEAIEALGETVETLIAGGYDRSADYTALGEYLVTSTVKTLLLFEPTGKMIWDAVISAGGEKRIKHFFVSSMREAVVLAKDETEVGNICLLSPASASFGLFKNYKDRGEQFRQEVIGKI
jgi:UDP-N-acetylmuramoylalanine--D-glutamate ligase